MMIESVFGGHSPAEWYGRVRRRARTVIGGLTSSTLITLVLIPVIYYLLERKRVPVAVVAPEALGHSGAD
jgi:hypothetical protein